MKFDVAIETDPQIQFQSSLTQDLQVDGNLRLRGTAANPSLSGRVNITQGQVVFYGTKFTINQGSIAFYNPSKIEPIFDIDLETRQQGVDVTLTISGPLNKLKLTPRSDPPMQFSEIVQLLATGSAPSTDPVILAQQTTHSQTVGQLGASTLLGQALTQPVGRLQRLFGVSKLRIDPTIGGLDSTAQARVTIEQQITPNLTFTYITNVTSSNPQVVRVEWALSRQWSAVALREENGVTGMDFFFKKRF
jgi:translocation and assembly module TamB